MIVEENKKISPIVFIFKALMALKSVNLNIIIISAIKETINAPYYLVKYPNIKQKVGYQLIKLWMITAYININPHSLFNI